jgi:3-phenylpropionate/trans-cinnamate dioxygenase ferredoxin component
MKRYVEIPAAKWPDAGGRAIWFVEGRIIALFNVDGVLYAIDDSCPHAGSSLFGGKLEGRTLQCRAHGLRFDLATGCMPGVREIRVKTYPIEVRDGRAYIELPEAQAARPAC